MCIRDRWVTSPPSPLPTGEGGSPGLGTLPSPVGRGVGGEVKAAGATVYLGTLLRAAVVTLFLSCLSMALAIAVGILVAAGRVYGSRVIRALLTVYVEVVRGTP